MESVSVTTGGDGGDGGAIMVLLPSLIEPQPLTHSMLSMLAWQIIY